MANNTLVVLYDKETKEKKVIYYGCVGIAAPKTSDEKYFYYSDWLGSDANPATESQPVKTLSKCVEIAKAYSGSEKYLHVINLDEVWFETDENKIVFIDTVAGNDNNSGLTYNEPIKTDAKLNQVLTTSGRRVVMLLNNNSSIIMMSMILSTIPIEILKQIKIQCRYAGHILDYDLVHIIDNNTQPIVAELLASFGSNFSAQCESGGYTGYELNNIYYGIDGDCSYSNMANWRRRHLLYNIVTGASAGELNMSSSLLSGQRISDAIYIKYYDKVFYLLRNPDDVKYTTRGSSSLSSLPSSFVSGFYALPHVEKLFPGKPRYHISGTTLSLIKTDLSLQSIFTLPDTGFKVSFIDEERLYLIKPTGLDTARILILKVINETNVSIEYDFNLVPMPTNYGDSCAISQNGNVIYSIYKINGKTYCEIVATEVVFFGRNFAVINLTDNVWVDEAQWMRYAYYDHNDKRIYYAYPYKKYIFNPLIKDFDVEFNPPNHYINAFRAFPCAAQGIDELRRSTFLHEKIINNVYYYYGFDAANSHKYFTNKFNIDFNYNVIYKLIATSYDIEFKSIDASNCIIDEQSGGSLFNIKRHVKNVDYIRSYSLKLYEINAKNVYLIYNAANIMYQFYDSSIEYMYAKTITLNNTTLKHAIIENLFFSENGTVLQDCAVLDTQATYVTAVNSYCQKKVDLFFYNPDLKLTGTTIKRLKRLVHGDGENSPLIGKGSLYFHYSGIASNPYDIGCFVPMVVDNEIVYKKSFPIIANYATIEHSIEFPSAEYKGETGSLDFYVDADLIYEILTITVSGVKKDYLYRFIDMLKIKNKEVKLLFDNEEYISTVTTTAAASANDVFITVNTPVIAAYYHIGNQEYFGLYLKSANQVVLDKPLHTNIAANTVIPIKIVGSLGEFVFTPQNVNYRRYVSTEPNMLDSITFRFKRKI